MSISVSEQKTAEKIAAKFNLPGKITGCMSFGSGHINNTFLLEMTENGGLTKKYILQAVNTNVFKNICAVMENIDRVTEHMKSRAESGEKIISFLKSTDGHTYYIDESDTFWRIYEFIDNSVSLDLPESNEDFYQCALAFGRFQRVLNDFPAESLHEIIPDFHNTPKRYADFLSSVREDRSGRAHLAENEIEFIKARKDFYSVLFDNYGAGKLPLRVSHNDTKCNNVLLDNTTRKALCVIDLDTIMPGFSVTDFGDAIRFSASTAAEDEKDLSKVKLDMEKFHVYTKGFLDGCGGLLSDSEIMLLPEGAKMMTAECGMRFLADFIDGDRYFKTEYPEHNLDRCRTQLKLVAEMEAHWAEMKECVSEYVGKRESNSSV